MKTLDEVLSVALDAVVERDHELIVWYRTRGARGPAKARVTLPNGEDAVIEVRRGIL